MIIWIWKLWFPIEKCKGKWWLWVCKSSWKTVLCNCILGCFGRNIGFRDFLFCLVSCGCFAFSVNDNVFHNLLKRAPQQLNLKAGQSSLVLVRKIVLEVVVQLSCVFQRFGCCLDLRIGFREPNFFVLFLAVVLPFSFIIDLCSVICWSAPRNNWI